MRKIKKIKTKEKTWKKGKVDNRWDWFGEKSKGNKNKEK